ELTLECPQRLAPGLPLGPLAGDVLLRRWVMPGLGEGDGVECPVELAIAAAVEPHPLGLARAGRDRGDPREHRERVGRAEASDVARLADELGSDQNAGS